MIFCSWNLLLYTQPLHAFDGYSRECRELRISGSIGWYPVLMESEQTKRLEGGAIELMRMIAADLDLQLKYVHYPWKRSLQHLALGSIDLILGIYKTSERARLYQYSPAYMVNEARIFTRVDKQFKLTTLADLEGLKGDQVLGGSFGDEFDSYAKAHLEMSELTSLAAQVRRLKLGRSDFLISDYHDASKEVAQQAKAKGSSAAVVALPLVIARNPVYFAMSKHSACAKLAPEIFAKLQAYVDSHSVELIARKKGYPFIVWHK